MASKEALYDEAIELQQQGNLEESMGRLNQLVADYPDYALPHAALAMFHSQQEQFDEAIEHSRKVCELEPEDPFSFTAMSLICQKAGRIDEAERALMQAQQAEMAAQNRSQA
jgi:Flp pilus assembly protein TadD